MHFQNKVNWSIKSSWRSDQRRPVCWGLDSCAVAARSLLFSSLCCVSPPLSIAPSCLSAPSIKGKNAQKLNPRKKEAADSYASCLSVTFLVIGERGCDSTGRKWWMTDVRTTTCARRQSGKYMREDRSEEGGGARATREGGRDAWRGRDPDRCPTSPQVKGRLSD